MSAAQLRLVTERPLQPAATTDPTRLVFEHWLAMFGRSPNRCKLGPTRRPVINSALALYELDQVFAAIEGAAADPWIAERGAPVDQLEYILRNESTIERYSEAGDRLRERVAQQLSAMRTAPVEPDAPVDPAAALEARERLRKLANTLSGRGQ